MSSGGSGQSDWGKIGISAISQQAYVKASNAGANDFFGRAVAISGDTLVVGAILEDGSGTGVAPVSDEGASGSGAAYVYVRSGGVWTFQAYLKASNTGAGDGFGRSVAVSGDTIVVGAYLEDGSGSGVDPVSDDLATDAGAAYVYKRSGGVWSLEATLKASNPGAGDQYGLGVAVSGETILVGALDEDGSGTGVNPLPDDLAPNAGAVYVYQRQGAVWSQQAYLKGANTEAGDNFGGFVALSGETAIVGALGEDGSGTGVNPASNENASNAGAAYVFVRSGTAWAQQAYLKASNAGAGDIFGQSVALSADTAMVGANLEDGSGSGVNPPSDEGAPNSGAAYVFKRSGTAWAQQAYLKASNPAPDDQYGVPVGVSGNMAVVGSWREDGSGTGINPLPDDLAGDSGAAFVYTRSGTTWSEQAYLKASNTEPGDSFGQRVAVSGDTVVVAAINEDGSGSGVNPVSSEGANSSGAVYVYAGIGPALDTDNDGLRDAWEQVWWPSASGHGPLDDEDHDGLVNLLEMAFGLNPTQGNGSPLPPAMNEGGYLTLTLTKQPGVTYEVQSAGTLLPLMPESFSAASTTVLLDNATTLKVRDNVLMSTPGGRFMRVQVTAAP
jgi:hypothetical protein